MGEWWDLWMLWWSGQQVHDESLWGYPVWSWARVGKVLQLSGVSLVLLELIGASRLRRGRAALDRAADGLRAPRNPAKAEGVEERNLIIGYILMVGVIGAIWMALTSVLIAYMPDSVLQGVVNVLAVLIWVIAFVPLIVRAFFGPRAPGWRGRLWRWSYRQLLATVTLLRRPALLLLAGLQRVLRGVQALFRYSTARVLLTVVSTVAILVGTSFDLLAS